MKNRIITRLFVLALAMVMMLFVVACNYTKPVETTPEQTTPEQTTPEPTTPPHTHTEEILPAVAATCTEAGLTEGKKCSDCGEIIVPQETVAALGHNEEVVAGKAATCTEAGLSEGKKCSVCGETTVAQEEIAATGHTYVDGACSACGAEEPLPLSNPIRINAETATEDRSADLGYKWDKDSATLTLCGMKLHFDKGVGILIEGIDVTVVIEGENTMVVTNYMDGDTGCYGFNTTNAITFEGEGTLNLTVGDFKADLLDTGAAAYGIFAKPSSITWNSGTLNLVCGTIDGNEATLRNIQGMRAVDVVINGGEVNIDTGLCFTTTKGAFLDGIYVTGSYTQNGGDVSISIGECIVLGTSTWIENLCICSDGSIAILGGTFEAKAANTSGFPAPGSAIAGKSITFAHGEILAGADENGTDKEYTNQLYLKFVRTIALSNPIRINAETASEDRSADLGYIWDKDTATLTLCGMELHFDKGVGILIEGIDVTVVINGKNTMIVTNYADGDTGCYGFNTTNAITFEGDGTLNMTVGDFKADLLDTGATAYGICAKTSNITWKSGTLNLVCGTIDGNDATLRNIQGFRAVNVVVDGGDINIATGLCFTTSKGAFLDGIYATGSYTQNGGNVSITIGECIVLGTSTWIENLCICSDGSIAILGGTFEAKAANTSGFPAPGSAIAGKTITFGYGNILAGADENGTDKEYTNQLYLKFVETIALSNPILINAETASEDRSADLGYKWDLDTKTLTLCGMWVHFDKGVGFKIDGIDVTVVIEGENIMVVTGYADNDTGCYGFNTTNAITFEGTGTLNMTVGDFKADLLDTGAAAYGIFAKPSSITWNSGTLNLVCGTIGGNEATLRNIQGMRAVDVVINGGEVNIDTGLCFTTAKGAFLDGIYVTGSYTQNGGDVSISIGECIVLGTSTWIENLCICSDGTIAINGGTFEAQAANTSGFPKRGSAIAGTITFGEGTIAAGADATGTDTEYTDQLYLKFVANA